MGFNSKSDYALNKKSEGIVYKFSAAVGGNSCIPEIVTLSAADFEEEKNARFAAIKAMSDDDYHETELYDKREDRQTVCLHSIEGTDWCAAESPEDKYFRHLDEQERTGIRTLDNAFGIMEKCLTEIQRRRFYQHFYLGWTTRKIAANEGVSQMTVFESLKSAEKKIKKFLKKE